MVTLRTGFEGCLNWLPLFGLSAETRYHRPQRSPSLPETRSEWRISEFQVREVLLHQCVQHRDRDSARPLGWLFWKSVRTLVISASQQTAMTAADSGRISVFKRASCTVIRLGRPCMTCKHQLTDYILFQKSSVSRCYRKKKHNYNIQKSNLWMF